MQTQPSTKLTTKAETLHALAARGYPVPPLVSFSVEEWRRNPDGIAEKARALAGMDDALAIRSSALAEDGADETHAGEFDSVLNVRSVDATAFTAAVDRVAASLPRPDDVIIAQIMVKDVVMAGVATTHTLSHGSPYYVVNYDDLSQSTDLVTSGRGNGKTVHVYRGVKDGFFDSRRLKIVIDLIRRLEAEFAGEALDIEFAVDARLEPHLLQVRRICAVGHWEGRDDDDVGRHIQHLAGFIRDSLGPRHGLYGEKSILGVMPDWNPAEIIGIFPRPLAFSLYRELITRRTWSRARELMGYRTMPPIELMLLVGGRPYIDVRASFNSFLPEGVAPATAERLLNAWIQRLDAHPACHDKVEFEIVPTVMTPGFAAFFRDRYDGLLSDDELRDYGERLADVTRAAMSPQSTLWTALDAADALRVEQDAVLGPELAEAPGMTPFDIALCLASGADICRERGTLPFSVAARHAFIAESWLRAAVDAGALAPERVERLKLGLKSVSGELTRDFGRVLDGHMSREDFLAVYGHLRPGTYDILSPSYRERADLFDIDERPPDPGAAEPFVPTVAERRNLDRLLSSTGLAADSSFFLRYVAAAIAGRERVKFIFSRHLSHLLDLLAVWAEKLSLSRDDVSMLPFGDVLDMLHKPLPLSGPEYYRDRIDTMRQEHRMGQSFELSYLIRSERDVFIVPQHRSAPNFITRKRIAAPVAYLDSHAADSGDLRGAVVCIESADPGYDWIFTRGIAGLITRYGGANSHMAIRCAEYGLPAAIGCGERYFERVVRAPACVLDCDSRTVTPAERLPGEGVL